MALQNSHRGRGVKIQKRPGWARGDFLAVVLCSLAAASVAFPAVMRATRDQQIMQCRDNLRRLGQAFYGYAADHRQAFPPGRYNTPHNHGWAPILLGHLGETELAKSYRWDVDFYSPENAKAIQTKLPVFLCPAVEGERNMTVEDPTGKPCGRAAVSDYFANGGVWRMVDYGASDEGRDGAVRNNLPRPLADFTDGLSTTFLVIEQAGRPNQWAHGKKTAPVNTVNGATWGPWAGFNSTGVQGYDQSGSQTPGPCAINCNNGRGVYAMHDQGAHALMADGSARFLKKDLAVSVLYALVTRAGGELLAQDDF